MEDSPMRKWYSSIFLVNAILVFVTVASSSLLAQSQGSEHATVLVPDSTVERAQDKGIRAHTNHLIRLQANPTPSPLALRGNTADDPACLQTAFDGRIAENRHCRCVRLPDR